MSEIRLNIVDWERTISGQVHGSVGDAVVAALSAEPETIHELELALERFVRPPREHSPSCSHHDSHTGGADEMDQVAHADHAPHADGASAADERAAWPSPFAFFRHGPDLEPYDAGIIVVDLAGRVVAVDSTYSLPQASGEVCCLGYEMLDHFTGDPFIDEDEMPDGEEIPGVEYISTDLADAANNTMPARLILPYRLPDDWLFVRSIPEYEGVCRERRARRSDLEPIDAREVLYGRGLLEFIAREMAAAAKAREASVPALAEPAIESETQAPEAGDDTENDSLAAADPEAYNLMVEAHAKWLMTGRNDLWGRTPREVLLDKQDSIGFDLHTRQLQWSFTGEPPSPIPSSSHAYRFAGFAVEEIVIYYYLVRFLMRESYKGACQKPETSLADEIARLEALKTGWLESPHRDYMNRSPMQIMESERRRLPIAVSGREAMVDEENCAVCAAMANDKTPYFWHLDGCNMDDRFEFSFHKTMEEWEAEQRSYEEFNREFAREQAERKAAGLDDDPTFDSDDEDDSLTVN